MLRSMTGLSSSCGACKFLRRKCTSECVFAPYFGYDEAATHFAAVHKVFGASNVSKLLSHLPMQHRSEAAITISYEALARMRDPIYGCVAHILALQQQVASLQEEIEILGNQMANLAVDVSSCGSLPATNNLNNGLQYPSQLNDINIQNYLNQQTPLFPHTGNTTANQAFDSLMTIQFPSVNGWEDKTFLSHDSNPWERLLEAIDQDILLSFPSTDNGSNIFI